MNIVNNREKRKRWKKKNGKNRNMEKLVIDKRINEENFYVERIGMWEIRMMNERRWKWIIMVKRRKGIKEIKKMKKIEKKMMNLEEGIVEKEIKKVKEWKKINKGEIGNVVRKLKVNVIERNEGDEGWKGKVWGNGVREKYEEKEEKKIIE